MPGVYGIEGVFEVEDFVLVVSEEVDGDDVKSDFAVFVLLVVCEPGFGTFGEGFFFAFVNLVFGQVSAGGGFDFYEDDLATFRFFGNDVNFVVFPSPVLGKDFPAQGFFNVLLSHFFATFTQSDSLWDWHVPAIYRGWRRRFVLGMSGATGSCA